MGGWHGRWLAGCRVFALGRVGDCQRSGERNATGKPVALVYNIISTGQGLNYGIRCLNSICMVLMS